MAYDSLLTKLDDMSSIDVSSHSQEMDLSPNIICGSGNTRLPMQSSLLYVCDDYMDKPVLLICLYIYLHIRIIAISKEKMVSLVTISPHL